MAGRSLEGERSEANATRTTIQVGPDLPPLPNRGPTYIKLPSGTERYAEI